MSAKYSVWLLLGPETGEKDDFIRELINSVKKERTACPEIYKYFLPDAAVIDIVSLLKNRLLFNEYKIIIIFNVELLSKSDAQIIAEYTKQPSSDSLLILCSDETRLSSRTIDEAVLPENKKVFWELLEHQKRGWIKNYFIKRGFKIEEEAIDFICEMVENNTHGLRLMCERLAGFFNKDVVIRYESIEQYVFHGKEENVFTLFAALVRRDWPLCLEILDKILLSHEEDGVRIVSGVSWQLNELLRFIYFIERGISREEVFQKLGVKSKRQQKLYTDARKNYTLEQLLQCVHLVSRFDVLLRTHNKTVHRLLLELFIYNFIMRRTILLSTEYVN